ncbi:hypothetical protein [Helicobacter apodemus]|uniref:Uncharacterized protein n=1 Tax=Helicobacter apodemus TaxID=135569 RepID=A0A2U8FFB0_9HELI|nr:hypothetical protein [Helicobacter apodemus]AWI34970.1 hypothetical protein CDV25_09505 [Helicobacter apodemus]
MRFANYLVVSIAASTAVYGVGFEAGGLSHSVLCGNNVWSDNCLVLRYLTPSSPVQVSKVAGDAKNPKLSIVQKTAGFRDVRFSNSNLGLINIDSPLGGFDKATIINSGTIGKNLNGGLSVSSNAILVINNDQNTSKITGTIKSSGYRGAIQIKNNLGNISAIAVYDNSDLTTITNKGTIGTITNNNSGRIRSFSNDKFIGGITNTKQATIVQGLQNRGTIRNFDNQGALQNNLANSGSIINFSNSGIQEVLPTQGTSQIYITEGKYPSCKIKEILQMYITFKL